jgi:hypothetical protein
MRQARWRGSRGTGGGRSGGQAVGGSGGRAVGRSGGRAVEHKRSHSALATDHRQDDSRYQPCRVTRCGSHPPAHCRCRTPVPFSPNQRPGQNGLIGRQHGLTDASADELASSDPITTWAPIRLPLDNCRENRNASFIQKASRVQNASLRSNSAQLRLLQSYAGRLPSTRPTLFPGARLEETSLEALR